MMPSHSHRENPTLAFERDLQLIEYAESLGFDEFWVGEHHSGGWETIPAPDIFLAAAATRTRRIRLGTAVINLPYHHPFHVAERMAFLDHLAYGRIMLGCGPGVLSPDIKLFGLSPTELRPMMNESLEIILKLYREDGPVSYEGKYWQIRDMEIQVKPYQQPHLPVFLVSSGSGNSVGEAARHGLPVISGVFTLPSALGLRQQWDLYEQEAKTQGHSLSRDEWRLSANIYLAESTGEAMRDIASGAMTELRQYFFNNGGKPTYEAYPGQPAASAPQVAKAPALADCSCQPLARATTRDYPISRPAGQFPNLPGWTRRYSDVIRLSRVSASHQAVTPCHLPRT